MYGRWLAYICEKLEITDREVAERAGLNPSTVNLVKRIGKNQPTRETVILLIEALHAIAREKGVRWEECWDMEIIHGAGYSTDEEIQASEDALEQYISSCDS